MNYVNDRQVDDALSFIQWIVLVCVDFMAAGGGG